jgi:hypothetical protein
MATILAHRHPGGAGSRHKGMPRQTTVESWARWLPPQPRLGREEPPVTCLLCL